MTIAATELRDSDVELAEASLLALGDLLFEISPNGEYLRCIGDPSMLLMPRAELIGKNVTDIFPDDIAREATATFDEVCRTGRPRTVRYVLDFNGHERHFESRIALATSGNLLLLTRDMQEQVLAERELAEAERHRRESENRFRVMADYAPVLLWMSDTTSLCTFFNQRWLEFSGRTMEEEWGNGWAQGIHFEDLQHAMHTYMTAFAQRKPFSMEYRLLRADGEFRWIYDQGTPRYEDDGTFAGFIGSCVDITERYEAHQALEELNNKLHVANQAKNEFLANMSHELRTPLNSVIGFADLMYRGEAGPIAENHHEYLGDILTSGRHLLSLINDILDLAKVEAGRLRLRFQPVDASEIAREVCDLMRHLATDRNVQLELETDSTLGQVTVDPDRLRQILFNYLSNAIKFSKPGTPVTIRVTSTGDDTFRIEVQDRGIGIKPEDANRLFRTFEQLDGGANKQHAGTGLGLALTKRLAEAHGGTVGADSVPGEGSCFWVELPRDTDIPAAC